MCLSPVTLRINNARYKNKWVVVGCGKCDECKKKYQNDWSIRLSKESECWENVWFITLTYRDECVPYVVDKLTGETHNSVCKEHCQKWLKSYRISYLREHNEVVHLKYFLTSEYGPRTLRPHYHMLLFGLDFIEVKKLCSIWEDKYGYTVCRKIPNDNRQKFAVSKYVAKYCSKGSYENPFVAQKRVKPTFHLISKGIGYNYVLKMKDYHLANDTNIKKYGDNNYKFGYITTSNDVHFSAKYIGCIVDRCRVTVVTKNGTTISYGMPRYYKEKIYGVQNILSDTIAEEILQRNEQIRIERATQLQAQYTDWSFDKAYGFTFLQDSVEANFRKEQLRRKNEKFYDKSRI